MPSNQIIADRPLAGVPGQDDDLAIFTAPRPSFDLRHILVAVRSHLWLIGGIIAGILTLALVYTLLQTARYTASSTIQINDSTARVLGRGQDAEDDSGPTNVYDTDRFLKTQIDILNSRGLALRVAQRLKLIGNKEFYAEQGAGQPSPKASPDDLHRQAVGMLMGNLSVKLPRDSRIATVSYKSANPVRSAQIANAYVAEFISSNLQRKFDSSSYARDFLSGQLADAKQRLEMSERAVNAYARSAGLIRTEPTTTDTSGSSTQTSVTTSSLAQLNAATNEATARRIQAEARWRSVSGSNALGSTDVITNPTVSTLLAQRASLQAALDEDRARHLEDYPSIRARVSQLAAIERQIQLGASNIRSGVRQDYQAALSAEQQLKAQVARLKGETLSEQDSNVQYNLLMREAETNRELYNGLLERYKQLNAASGVSLSNIYVIDKAEVPSSPSSPNLFKNLLLALILSLAIAVTVVFLKDQFDDSIRMPEDVEPKLGLPLLGVVPNSALDDPQADLADPKSAISEAFNSLRSSLLYSTPEGLPRTILVTSAQASEGKTTSSFAIAAGLARMGKNILLIDADLRRPALHRRNGSENSRGLSDLLTSHDPIGTAVVPTKTANLSMIHAGPVPPSPTELLSTDRIEQILDQATKQFDVVVIDSPPVLGLADAPLIAGLVGGVIFVVEADRARHGSLKTSLRRLRAMRPLILGAVLTKFDPTKAGNRYSEYYGYNYYQYDSDGRS
ncbi:polysaccharide biosynthesis tyrosine autokinase [Novosphingobium sp.]|uniref:GumC family protein n=1 Tax=Novosphingobium sp. TaxID=1874826 RepID=UPI0025DD183D|nr:polysaccharide biosynthesis tyrosine autokinase [Novosphingobium sp.]